MTSTIPAYFKKQSLPIISYSYSSPIAPKIFNHKNVLQGQNTENIIRNPSACSCKASEFCYNPAGHIITDDLNIGWIRKLRDIPKVLNTGNPDILLGNRIPNKFWILLKGMHDAGQRKRTLWWWWGVDTLSEWVKTVMSLANRRAQYSAEPCLADMNLCLMNQMLLLS